MLRLAPAVAVLLVASCSGGSNGANDGAEVQTLAGRGEAGYVDGDLDSARFTSPEGLAVGTDGTVYVVETLSGRIRAIAPGGAVRTVVTSAESELRAPHRIAIGSSGAVFVTDTGNHRVVRVSATGEVITIAGSAADGNVSTVIGQAGAGTRDGQLERAQLGGPSGLAFSGAGTLLVADTFAHRLREIVLEDQIRTIAGDGDRGFRDGDANRARFDRPTALAIGPDGSLFIADTGNHAIRRVLLFSAALAE